VGNVFDRRRPARLQGEYLVLGINTASNTTKCYRFTALAAFDATNPNADHVATLSA